MSKENDKARESKLRTQAKSKGFILSKSKIKVATIDNRGGYRIVDARTNTIEAGEKYDLTLDEAENFLSG